jgi:uridine phosphorylase
MDRRTATAESLIPGTQARKSITSASQYLAHLRGSGLALPAIPRRCIVSYVSDVIESAKARFPCRSVSLGSINPMWVHFFMPEDDAPFAIVRGLHGAPMAAVLLEELVALGFEEFLVLGPAGHPTNRVRPDLHPGDLLLVTEARIFEGTSPHYGRDRHCCAGAAALARLQRIVRQLGIACREGATATTDALYRETPEFIEELIGQEILAVEMELSALFTVAEFHRKQLCGLVFISDLVRLDGRWEIGFSHESFHTVVENLSSIALEYAKP